MDAMKIAFVADWLTVYGGAEHVIAEFHKLWPQAPLFTTVARKQMVQSLELSAIRASTLQGPYALFPWHQIFLPWMPRTIECLDIRGYDIILSSSHAVGKGVIPPSCAVHICYCHTPMRYAWEMEKEYLEDYRIPRVLRPIVRGFLKKLRRWDLSTAKRVDAFIANSTTTKDRIMRTYGRDSTVIPPPVHERFFRTALVPHPAKKVDPYFLAVGRLVPYKRFDLLIEAANRLRIPLKIAGSGHDAKRLRSLAGPTVEFLGFVPDEDLPRLYDHAQALLFAPLEDAGVVPLEAQASGTPVIAYGKGGVLDAVKEGKTGLFFEKQSCDSIVDAIQRFSRCSFDPSHIRSHATQFSAGEFRKHIQDIIRQTFKKFGRTGASSATMPACAA